MKNAEESVGTGTGQTEDITNVLIFQKRICEESNGLCNLKFPYP
jgi:hypothetical protein